MFFDYTSFTDELEKIASAAWKRKLRAGLFGAAETAQMKRMGLLDPAREIAGMRVGNKEIARKLMEQQGVEHSPSLRDLTAAKVVQSVRERSAKPLLDVPKRSLATLSGGGGVAAVTPGQKPFTQVSKTILRKSQQAAGGKPLRPFDQDAFETLMERHELDEMREAVRQAKKKGVISPKMVLTSPPANPVQEGVATSLDLQRKTMQRMRRSSNPKLQTAGRFMDIGAQAQHGMPLSKIPEGELVTGRHFGPSVILQESRNVATFPEAVREQARLLRAGEQRALQAQGLQYGQFPEKARRYHQIARAMEQSA